MSRDIYWINGKFWLRVTDGYGTCIRYELVPDFADFFEQQKELLDESNS